PPVLASENSQRKCAPKSTGREEERRQQSILDRCNSYSCYLPAHTHTHTVGESSGNRNRDWRTHARTRTVSSLRIARAATASVVRLRFSHQFHARLIRLQITTNLLRVDRTPCPPPQPVFTVSNQRERSHHRRRRLRRRRRRLFWFCPIRHSPFLLLLVQ